MTSNRDNLTLIRMYLDGELAADERTQVERMVREDRHCQQVYEFERALREQVGRAMIKTSSAPPKLTESVRSALREADRPAHETEADEPAVAGTIGRASPNEDRARDQYRANAADASGGLFTGPRKVNLFAATAAVMLIVGAILFGLLGPPIDRIGASSTNLVAKAALFISNHHQACVTDPTQRAREMRFQDPSAARTALARHLENRPMVVFDLNGIGYAFRAAGPCKVPGYPVSGHLWYQRADAAGPSGGVSVFAVPDLGQFPADRGRMQPGRWYRANGGPQARHRVMRITDGRLVYFVVTGDAEELETICRSISRQLRDASDR